MKWSLPADTSFKVRGVKNQRADLIAFLYQSHFGMKDHIGVDSKTGLIHSAAVTPAHTHDIQVVEHRLHGNETKVWGDSAYSGQGEKIKAKSPRAQAMTNGRGRRNSPLTDRQKAKNKTKSKARAAV